MRNILYIIEKEFKHILRNKSILPAIFMAPMIQLIIMPLAADYEIKNINLAIVSGHYSPETNQLIKKITGSGFFKLVKETTSFEEGKELIERDEADLVLQIPNDLESDLVKEKKTKVLIYVNAINGTKANIGATYLSSILKSYNLEFIQKEFGLSNPVDLRYSNWYNQHMNYPFFIVPGVLVTLVTMIGAYMCSLNIVKEKELGTIEQINVTPIKKHEFILGKLIPFWLLFCRYGHLWNQAIRINCLVIPIFSGLFNCRFRFGPTHFNLFTNPTASHVSRFLFHDDFYVDERTFYPNRKHASMGHNLSQIQSRNVFY